MTNVPNFGAASLLGVAEHWTSIQTVFHYCLLIEEFLWWCPVREQSSGQCCSTPSSLRRTVGVCESLPEHSAILLCIEVHFVWVVLLVVRLVSTKIVRHPCEVEVVGAVFPKRVFPLSGDMVDLARPRTCGSRVAWVPTKTHEVAS